MPSQEEPKRQRGYGKEYGYVGKKAKDFGLKNPKCPICGRALLIRHRRRDNHEFFGCSNYPRCTYACDLADGYLLLKEDEPQ